MSIKVRLLLNYYKRNNMNPVFPRYILTLSCADVMGIVAKVSGFLLENKCFIIESAQFGDEHTGRFFMRTVFEAHDGPSYEEWCKRFSVVAEAFTMKWQLQDTTRKPRVMIMVSKQRHCLNDLLHRYATGWLNMEIAAVVSNHADLAEMAEWYKIPFHHLPVSPETKMEQEAEILNIINKLNVDLVVLARYMQVLSSGLSAKLKGRAINIHHSFLPSFKGAKPYHQAYERGVKRIGATAHYVTDDLDEGPIIEQEVIAVDHTHSPNDLVALGCDIENQVLARAVKYHIERRVLLNGSKTVVFK